jgi:glutamate:Na+ symporter, ESS family
VISVVKLNAVQVLALSGAVVVFGLWLKRTVSILNRLNIPASIAGGLVFAALALLAHTRSFNLEIDTTLRDVLVIAAFTTIGMTASLRVLRRGGVQVAVMTGLALTAAFLQAVVGIGVARSFGIDGRIGVLASTVALAGGPATSLAFGPLFERLGVGGATTMALASATFGITVAGIIAGWTGGSLIRRFQLAPSAESAHLQPASAAQSNSASLLTHALLIIVAMGIGNVISSGFARIGIILPGYVGAMIVAVIIRNVDASTEWFGIHQGTVEQILSVVLPLFIAMSMITLRLWELAAIAWPLLTILIVEVVVTWLFSAVVVFIAIGRDYQAAVTSAGFCGFMVGITPNAIASMEELTDTYGPAPQAFLIIPLIGGFLSDLTNSLVITTFANLLR